MSSHLKDMSSESIPGSPYRDDDEFAEVEAKLVGFLTVNSCPIFNSRPLLNLPLWFD